MINTAEIIRANSPIKLVLAMVFLWLTRKKNDAEIKKVEAINKMTNRQLESNLLEIFLNIYIMVI